MGDNKYEFDLRSFSLRKAGGRISHAVWTAVKFVLSVLSLAVVAYAIACNFYSTDEEKALKAENKSFEEIYAAMPGKLDRIGEDLDRLSKKDDIIYKDIFHSDPPADDPMSSLSIFFGSDSIPDSKLVFYTARKADPLVADAASVDSLFKHIVECLKQENYVMPPMELPLQGISYTQTGAGIGTKINPFYTTTAHHNGVDFIVSQGTPVLAPAGGVVSKVNKSRKGEGNTVTITHKGGYITRYAHLSDIYVSQGQNVRKGAKIGTAGMSGNAYAPHLHYEVWRDSTLLDPLNYIFASVKPEDYTNMVYMARHTKQSMD
jgi:murein DD-endopeptidase MepM/ murein hydrolase activator NlpD